MKRQRNTQEVKEHERCPPSQTKEEVGNLPEKKIRIMVIKMIQNLENKMEIQINSLGTKIEKMQEMSNKDLEEIKKNQLKMNNACAAVESASAAAGDWRDVSHHLAGTAYQEARRQNLC